MGIITQPITKTKGCPNRCPFFMPIHNLNNVPKTHYNLFGINTYLSIDKSLDTMLDYSAILYYYILILYNIKIINNS